MSGELGALRGTLPYMSPEQVLGQIVDHRSDLFSVGTILWELIANRRLFDGPSDFTVMHEVRDARVQDIRTLRSGLSEYSARVVRKAVLPDRGSRFQSASEFRAALEQLAARERTTPAPADVRALVETLC